MCFSVKLLTNTWLILGRIELIMKIGLFP